MARIETLAQLEATVGAMPPAMQLKVIDHLDAGARRWLSESPLGFLACGVPGRVAITALGGLPGIAGGSERTLALPLAVADHPDVLVPGAPAAALFLLPGIGETLRVNGRVEAVAADHATIAVAECYGHCAKALIRSDFWRATPKAAPGDLDAWIAATRFVALASIGDHDAADVSPKGDPAGCMVQRDGDVLWFADRPGNRRVDSFRNIVVQPQVALALLLPGTPAVARASGRAFLTTDAAARARFAVQGKVPLLAVGVELESLDLVPSAALTRAAPWPVIAPSTIDPGKLFVEHIRRNRTPGAAAAVARAGMAVPGIVGMVRKGLEKDYRENLY